MIVKINVLEITGWRRSLRGRLSARWLRHDGLGYRRKFQILNTEYGNRAISTDSCDLWRAQWRFTIRRLSRCLLLMKCLRVTVRRIKFRYWAAFVSRLVTVMVCWLIVPRAELPGAFPVGRVGDGGCCSPPVMSDYRAIAGLRHCRRYAARRVTRQRRHVLCVPANTTTWCLWELTFRHCREPHFLTLRFTQFFHSVQASNHHSLDWHLLPHVACAM